LVRKLNPEIAIENPLLGLSMRGFLGIVGEAIRGRHLFGFNFSDQR
jgi:hypothetical protein